MPLFDGFLELCEPDGQTRSVQMRHGEPYMHERGVEHNLFNGNAFECAFIEIDFLKQP